MHNRIKKIIKFYDLSLAKFDSIIGRSNGYTSRLLRKQSAVPHDYIDDIIVNFVAISPYWLITGKGEMVSTTLLEAFNATVICDKTGCVTNINDEYSKQTGFALKEIKGKKPGAYLSRAEFIDEIREKTKQKRNLIYAEISNNFHKLGFPLLCRIFIQPIIYNGEITMFIGHCNFKRL